MRDGVAAAIQLYDESLPPSLLPACDGRTKSSAMESFLPGVLLTAAVLPQVLLMRFEFAASLYYEAHSMFTIAVILAPNRFTMRAT